MCPDDKCLFLVTEYDSLEPIVFGKRQLERELKEFIYPRDHIWLLRLCF